MTQDYKLMASRAEKAYVRTHTYTETMRPVPSSENQYYQRDLKLVSVSQRNRFRFHCTNESHNHKIYRDNRNLKETNKTQNL